MVVTILIKVFLVAKKQNKTKQNKNKTKNKKQHFRMSKAVFKYLRGGVCVCVCVHVSM